MSASIKTSLNKLNAAVYKLEGALEAKKQQQAAAAVAAAAKKKAAPEGDLFSAVTAGQQQNASNMNPMNVRMLASRLDTAISQVEKILKDGRA